MRFAALLAAAFLLVAAGVPCATGEETYAMKVTVGGMT
jgi:hypothetical protein